MQYPKYSLMKKSGHYWFDYIPESWDSVTIRLISKRYSGGTPDKKNSDYWQDGEIPWLNSGTVNQGVITEPTTFITNEAFDKSSAKWIPKGSIIIALAGQGKTKGTAAYTSFRTTCNQSMAAIVFEDDFPKFMYWYLTCQYKKIRGLASDDARDGLNLEMIGSIPCSRPSLIEQTQIANFLDYKTAQIDKLIEKKKQLIEKLNEKRIAVITQAVTKGLDPTVPMKDSGVDWLGEVPKHWDVKRLKDVCTIRYGLSEPPKYVDDGLPFIRAPDVYRGIIDSSKMKYLLPEDVPWEKNPSLRTGEIIVVRSGAYTGDSAIVPPDFDGAIAGFDMVVSVINCEASYVAFALLSTYMLNYQIELARKRAAQPHLNSEQLGGFTFLEPPSHEQKNIINHLKITIVHIAKQLEKTKKTIAILEEYRTALITAAVTGKIDVREIQIPNEDT